MANPVLILVIVVIAVLIGLQILGKLKKKNDSHNTTGTAASTPVLASPLRDHPGIDTMADLRQELEALTAAVGDQPSGDEPPAHVVRSLVLITAKLQNLEQRVLKMEHRAEREAQQRQMYEK